MSFFTPINLQFMNDFHQHQFINKSQRFSLCRITCLCRRYHSSIEHLNPSNRFSLSQPVLRSSTAEGGRERVWVRENPSSQNPLPIQGGRANSKFIQLSTINRLWQPLPAIASLPTKNPRHGQTRKNRQNSQCFLQNRACFLPNFHANQKKHNRSCRSGGRILSCVLNSL